MSKLLTAVLIDIPVVSKQLLPFTYTRPISDIRLGIFTISEKWASYDAIVRAIPARQLGHHHTTYCAENSFTAIASHIIPTEPLVKAIKTLKVGEQLWHQKQLIAVKLDTADHFSGQDFSSIEKDENALTFVGDLIEILHPWSIFQQLSKSIQLDFDWITKNQISQPIDEHNLIIGDKRKVFLADNAKVQGCTFNTSTGPIYIGEGATIMEGSLIRGPFVLADHATVKMGAKIYGATAIGKHCKVGGEINNSSIQDYSNKGHDGFLGNSVIGSWCNLGADTNNSNLKNNYGAVKAWSYQNEDFESTGLQFCGLMMGDHSKSGINTMFNTGTVVGVAANIFGGGFPNKFIPSFTWGGIHQSETFKLEKAYEVAERMMERRSIAFTESDKAILKDIFEETADYRSKYNQP